MKVVVDSSILIDHLRGGSSLLNFLKDIDSNASLYLPTIVLFELFAGQSTKDTSVRQKILRLTTKLQKIDLTENIAERAGQLYRDISDNLGAPDYIIAATSLEIGAEIVTLNNKHFAKIPGVRIYDFE